MRKTMNSFEDLENTWKNQNRLSPRKSAEDLINSAEAEIAGMKIKQRGTVLILSLTVAILLLYLVWMQAYRHAWFFTGLLIMIGMLAIRIVLEVVSYARFQRISPNKSTNAYCEEIIAYYHWRRSIHYIFTPIIYVSYVAAFVSLMPLFKANMSPGLYWYVLISGVIVFIGLALLIYHQIKKEMTILNSLKSSAQEHFYS